MIKIWGRKNSINVQKVLWCCDELNLVYQRVDMGLQNGDVDTPAYRAINPNGLVPTIEDGEFVLWESNTILRYLAAKYATGNLWPDSLETRAHADRWMDWHLSTLWMHMRPLFLQLVRCDPDQRDRSIIDESHGKTLDALKILDAHLGSNQYVAGNEFTIGDIPVGAATYRWMTLPIERPELPNLQAWYARLGEREAYRQHVMLPMS
jgi:glutathione S-transferase